MNLPDKKELMKEPVSEFDKIKAVMPDDIIVGVEESPEDFVEREGLGVAQSLLHTSADITREAACIEDTIGMNVDLLTDEDIDALKEVVGELKAQAIKVSRLADTYDEAEISDSARKSLKKLLK